MSRFFFVNAENLRIFSSEDLRLLPALPCFYRAEQTELSGREANGPSPLMPMAEPASGPQTLFISALEGVPAGSQPTLIFQIVLSKGTHSMQGARGQVAMHEAILPRS